jgi:hypothetical protein
MNLTPTTTKTFTLRPTEEEASEIRAWCSRISAKLAGDLYSSLCVQGAPVSKIELTGDISE